MPTFEIGFNVKFDNNLASHIRWVEWMSSTSFPQEIMKRWSQAGHIKRLIQLGRSIVNEQIYSISHGDRKIEESVTAKIIQAGQSDGKSIGGATVFLDPNISGAKGPIEGMDKSKVSYASFFERSEFNSFLLGAGVDIFNPIKYRPFFDAWTAGFFELEEREYLRSFMAAVKYKLPKHEAN